MAAFSRREILCAPALFLLKPEKPVVSVAKVRNGNIEAAVEHAIDLLGGVLQVTKGRERITLKPNLVSPLPKATTKIPVIRALAQMMKAAGKDVSIAEGSAAAGGFNVIGGEIFRTSNPDLLNRMQQYVFDQLGYTDLAKSLRLPLVNLHTGDLDEVRVPNAFVFDKVTVHRSLIDTDMLCSVPMMKTHTLAGVTLSMKNLVGVFPGTIYQSVRGRMHDITSKVDPSGTAAAVVDMVRANKLGLAVIDGSTAMEGNGPSEGELVDMGTIVASTNPLAADIVAANLMGFAESEIPTFAWANKAGLAPAEVSHIEIRGDYSAASVRAFKKPNVVPWTVARRFWATREM